MMEIRDKNNKLHMIFSNDYKDEKHFLTTYNEFQMHNLI